MSVFDGTYGVALSLHVQVWLKKNCTEEPVTLIDAFRPCPVLAEQSPQAPALPPLHATSVVKLVARFEMWNEISSLDLLIFSTSQLGTENDLDVHPAVKSGVNGSGTCAETRAAAETASRERRVATMVREVQTVN